MGVAPEHRLDGARRRGSAPVLAAIAVALTMAFASPAQATPNGATAWGANNSGELGTGTTEGPEKCGPEAKACSTTPVAVPSGAPKLGEHNEEVWQGLVGLSTEELADHRSAGII